MNLQDSILYLTVLGLTPSKKNSRVPFIRNGRMMNFPSKRYTDWHKIALQSLKNAPVGIDKTEFVELTIYRDTKRKFDLSNKAESVMDLLVDAGILLDDNYEVVPKLVLNYGGLDKNNPRCEVTIIPVHR